MKRVSGDVWIIHDEDDFYINCEPAKAIMEHAEAEQKIPDYRWFFKECYANWKNMIFIALFCSYEIPSFANYILSIQAKKHGDGRWEIKTIKKINSWLYEA